MSKHHFTFTEVFKFGWDKTKQHAWFIFLTFIISSTIICATVLNPIVNLLVVLMVMLSIASISLMMVRNHSFSFADLGYPLLSPRRVLKFFALSTLYSIPALVIMLTSAVFGTASANGISSVAAFSLLLTMVLLVPAIFIAVRFNFYPFIAVEHEHSSVKDLIGMSFKLTEGYFWKIFGFMLIITLINLVALIPLGLGLFVTVPVTIFATAHLYDKLKNHSA